MQWLSEQMDPATQKDSCLHLVVRTSTDVINRCRAMLGPADEVLFLDDGVMSLLLELSGASRDLVSEGIYLTADLEARGILDLARTHAARLAADSDLAGLLGRHQKTLTWK